MGQKKTKIIQMQRCLVEAFIVIMHNYKNKTFFQTDYMFLVALETLLLTHQELFGVSLSFMSGKPLSVNPTLHIFLDKCSMPWHKTKMASFFLGNSCSNKMQQGTQLISETHNCCLRDSWIDARKYTARRHKITLQWVCNLACLLF